MVDLTNNILDQVNNLSHRFSNLVLPREFFVVGLDLTPVPLLKVMHVPQVADRKTPYLMGVTREALLYDEFRTHGCLA